MIEPPLPNLAENNKESNLGLLRSNTSLIISNNNRSTKCYWFCAPLDLSPEAQKLKSQLLLCSSHGCSCSFKKLLLQDELSSSSLGLVVSCTTSLNRFPLFSNLWKRGTVTPPVFDSNQWWHTALNFLFKAAVEASRSMISSCHLNGCGNHCYAGLMATSPENINEDRVKHQLVASSVQYIQYISTVYHLHSHAGM